MKLSKFLHVVFVVVLQLVVVPSHADDTDLFNQPPGSGSPAPNIIFMLDNTANWSRASQQWAGSPTAGDAEILAIKNFVAGLTQPANVGLMALLLSYRSNSLRVSTPMICCFPASFSVSNHAIYKAC